MKKNYLKLLGLLLVVMLLTSVFGACTPKATPSEDADAPATDAGKGDQAASEGFAWDKCAGTELNLLLLQHPYVEAMMKKLPEFEELTGIKVNVSITAEDNYFTKLTTGLSSQSGEFDAYMAGMYQIWEYAPSGFMEPLDDYISDPNQTNPDYDVDDFFPSIFNSLRWDGKAGEAMGEGPLWLIPIGFETNDIMYNKTIFEEQGLTPPTTLEELLAVSKALKEFDGPGSYGVATRGTKSWGSLITAYYTTYLSFGATDFNVEDGKLVAKVNSPEAVAATDYWVELIREGGPPQWSTYTWYQCGADAGAGKAAMLFDANNNGFYQNIEGNSQEAGNFAWTKVPILANGEELRSNHWTWAVGMNSAAKNKDAAWLWIQWFTGKEYQDWAAVEARVINAPRASTFALPEYQAILNEGDNYLATFMDTVEFSGLYITPQPYFYECYDLWAGVLQELVEGKYESTQAGMDYLKAELDKIVEDVEVE